MKRRSAAPLALAFALAATSAAADCPTARDLETGIVVAFDDGSLVRYRAGTGLQVIEDVFYDDSFDEGYRLTTLGGVLPLLAMDFDRRGLDRASAVRTGYAMPEAAFPVLTAGLAWSVEATLLEEGADPIRQSIAMTLGTAVERDWGACRYAVLPLTLVFGDDGGEATDAFDHVVPLGIGVFLGNVTPDAPTPPYTPVSISRILPGRMPAID